MWNGTRWFGRLSAPVLIFAALATACGGGSGGDAAEEATAPAAIPGETATAAPSSAPPSLGSDDATVLSVAPRIGPSIVKTARVSIRVPRGRFQEAFGEASSIATAYGGFVEASSTRGAKSDSGSLTMRVPVDSFADAMAELRALGTVQSETLSGRDVTTQFVDLDARIRNLEAQEGVLLGFLQNAKTVAASLQVQRTLSDVQLQLEQLQGQRRALRDRADFSTIHVELFEGEPPAPVEVASVDQPRLGEAVDRAQAVFLGIVYSAVVALGVIIPLGLLGLVAFVVVRRVRPRLREASER